MKSTLLLGIGFLAAGLVGCNSKQTSFNSKETGSAVNGNGSSITVAAAADSTQRFELWLLSQKHDPTVTVSKGQTVDYILKDLDFHKLQTLSSSLGMSEWQADVIWSWGDMGPMETEVQKEIVRLDGKYNKKMYATCIWPGGVVGRVGRACVMQNDACDAARNKFDQEALDISVATQLHNSFAANTVLGAGAYAVADFLRKNRGCQ